MESSKENFETSIRLEQYKNLKAALEIELQSLGGGDDIWKHRKCSTGPREAVGRTRNVPKSSRHLATSVASYRARPGPADQLFYGEQF